MRGRQILVFTFVIVTLCTNTGCKIPPLQPPPPNTKFDIAVVNDKPSTWANFSVLITGNSYLAGQILPFSIPIDQTGKGAIRVNTFGHGPVDITDFVCGSGFRPPLTLEFKHINLQNNPKRTVDCQFVKPIPAAAGWESFSDSMDKVHLDKNPEIVSPIAASSADPYNEANRESAARSFLSQHETNVRQANVLYDCMLSTTPQIGRAHV